MFYSCLNLIFLLYNLLSNCKTITFALVSVLKANTVSFIFKINEKDHYVFEKSFVLKKQLMLETLRMNH